MLYASCNIPGKLVVKEKRSSVQPVATGQGLDV